MFVSSSKMFTFANIAVGSRRRCGAAVGGRRRRVRLARLLGTVLRVVCVEHVTDVTEQPRGHSPCLTPVTINIIIFLVMSRDLKKYIVLFNVVSLYLQKNRFADYSSAFEGLHSCHELFVLALHVHYNGVEEAHLAIDHLLVVRNPV